ncbi:hypothetical protein GCM10020219_085730 [Nonomuraea dietziae]
MPAVAERPRRLQDPGAAVGSVFGEGLVRPLAGDQDAAARVAEVFGLVALAPALSGSLARLGALGLHAVASQFGQVGEHGS